MEHRNNPKVIRESELKPIINIPISDTVKELIEHIFDVEIIPLVQVITLHLSEPLDEGEARANGFVLEAKDKFNPIPGTRYTYRFDIPSGEPRPGRLKHAHIFTKKGKPKCTVNIDGTAHDGCRNIEIPKEVADFLRQKGFSIPEDNIIEILMCNAQGDILFD